MNISTIIFCLIGGFMIWRSTTQTNKFYKWMDLVIGTLCFTGNFLIVIDWVIKHFHLI
jgi:hypothetical protein